MKIHKLLFVLALVVMIGGCAVGVADRDTTAGWQNEEWQDQGFRGRATSSPRVPTTPSGDLYSPYPPYHRPSK